MKKSFFNTIKSPNTLTTLGLVACFLACTGDFAAVFILSPYYPGYDHLRQPMSALGASNSPVSAIMSAWWITIGVLFIIFAFGFYKAFPKEDKLKNLAAWLILIYGIGEEIGSGVFPGNHLDGHLTNIGIIHNIIGGIGVAGLLILPFILMKYFPKQQSQAFHYISVTAAILGMTFFFIFTLSKIMPLPENNIISYRGLWQSLYIGVYYIYLMIISVKVKMMAGIYIYNQNIKPC